MPRDTREGAMDPAFAAANAAYQALRDLKGDDLSAAVDMLSRRLGVAIGSPDQQQSGRQHSGAGQAHVSHGQGKSGSASTPKDFMKHKQPAKEIERVACLAYFLVHHRSTDAFRSKELLELNTEARGGAFSNIAVHLDNATKAGYLTSVGAGRKGITARGEALVEALPSREEVNSALAANPTRARRKGKKAKRPT